MFLLGTSRAAPCPAPHGVAWKFSTRPTHGRVVWSGVVRWRERGTPAFGVSVQARVVPLALHAGDHGAEPVPRVEPGMQHRQRVGVRSQTRGLEVTAGRAARSARSPAFKQGPDKNPSGNKVVSRVVLTCRGD
jgi:hypothetical protein